MPSPGRPVLRRAFALAAALAALPPLAAQSQGRLQPGSPGWQDRLNDAFGTLLGWASAVPFYDVAGWLGIDTSPHRLVGADGAPATASLVLPTTGSSVQVAFFTSTGRRVVTADADHVVRVFSLFRARWRQLDERRRDVPDPLLAVLRGHQGPIVACDQFPVAAARVQLTDDFYRRAELLTASADGTARIWRLCTPVEEDEDRHATAPVQPVEREARLVLEHGAPLTSAVYSATGRWVATGGTDGNAIVWDAQGKRHRQFEGHQGGVQSLRFVGDDRLGVGAAASGVRWYDPDRGESAPAPEAPARTDPPPPHLAAAVTLQGSEPTLVLAGGDTLPLRGHQQAVLGHHIAGDATRALTWSADGTVRVWEWLARGPTGNVTTVALPFVVLWLVLAAVLFTLFFRFVNVRLFTHAIACVRGRFSNPADQGEVSHFQALSAALSATVGLGNIAGVAIAVMIGGPGATFWMVVAGLLGMTLKFTECTLGQKYRRIDADGVVSGGPMHYLKDGIAQRWPALAALGAPLATVFSLCCIGGSLAGGNAFQVNQSLGVVRSQIEFFDHQPWVYGLLMAVAAGIVIIGGIKSIAKVADKIVPLMCGLYVLAALTLIVMCAGDVPAACGRILDGAFTGDAAYGGAIGAMIMGFRRAAFSNEAGVGSASIAHSAARTPYAAREGLVSLLEPFIDTVIVCTMTGLVIGITGVYAAPEHAEIIAAQNGAGLTAEAFKSVAAFRPWFPWLLLVAVALFAYSTMISWSYYGERCATNLFGPRASLPFKLLFLEFTVLGSVVTAGNVLEFGDLMILLMAFPNLIGLYLLGGVVKRELGDYEQRLRSGEIRPFR